MIVEIILLLFIVFLFIILSMIWPPDSPWAPWWRTNKDVAREMCKMVQITKKDVIYDLGCGEGTAVLTAATEYGAHCVGIEIDPIRYYIAKMRVLINGLKEKVSIKRCNFFAINLSEASIIFVYLVPKTLQRLKPKFLKELKKGTRIISYRYEMDLPLLKKDSRRGIFIYKI